MSSIESDAANKHRVQIKYNFSIKNLIQNKSKSTGRNYRKYLPGCRHGVMKVRSFVGSYLAIIESPNCFTVLKN